MPKFLRDLPAYIAETLKVRKMRCTECAEYFNVATTPYKAGTCFGCWHPEDYRNNLTTWTYDWFFRFNEVWVLTGDQADCPAQFKLRNHLVKIYPELIAANPTIKPMLLRILASKNPWGTSTKAWRAFGDILLPLCQEPI